MTKPRDGAGPSRVVLPMLLAVGNPAISKQTAEQGSRLSGATTIDSSPESENEVRSLERLYSAARSKVYVGAQASESLVKQDAGKFNVIHLAAPALLSDASPLYSRIALSQTEENGNDDGLLEVREILKLNLSAELLVLSSSEVARDRYATGEAVSCLAWSLFTFDNRIDIGIASRLAGRFDAASSGFQGEGPATSNAQSPSERAVSTSLLLGWFFSGRRLQIVILKSSAARCDRPLPSKAPDNP